MDKKDEVNEIVQLKTDFYDKSYLEKNTHTDNEKKDINDEFLGKNSQTNSGSKDNNNEYLRNNSQANTNIKDNKNNNQCLRNNSQPNANNKNNKNETNNIEFKSNVKSIYKKQPIKNPVINPQRKPVNGYITTKNENKWGHRIRLRNRFRTGGIKGLTDYEALELLLFYTIEKIDTKSIAYNLINEFGSIEKVFSESYERILAVLQKDIRPSKQECVKSAFLIKFIRSFAILLWKRGIENRLKGKENYIKSGVELLAYLKEQYKNYLETDMRDLSYEQFRVIFLDAKNKILKDEVMFEGTINQTGVYPRQILKRALELNATAIIAVHNHPAGSLKPSNADISVTRTLQTACESLGISLLDHLIIGDRLCNGDDQQKSFYSFAENGLL